ncbi:MAG: chromate transporter [Succiniclasticum sp.]|jgi:chromate transporter
MADILALFLSFAKVGLFCVGGGYASLPLIQEEVVARHAWMTMNEFVDIFTISQMTPGPIGINAATFVGAKVAGIPGSVSATAGFVFPSVIIVLLLAFLYYRYGNVGPIRGVLNALRPAVVALIGNAGIGIVLLALWNQEKPPVHLADTDLLGLFILLVSLFLIRHQFGTIRTLALSGVLGLVLYLAFGVVV